MLQLWVNLRFERGGFGAQETPNAGSAIAVLGIGSNGVAGLEGKVFLNAIHRREVVVFDLAEL